VIVVVVGDPRGDYAYVSVFRDLLASAAYVCEPEYRTSTRVSSSKLEA
jgi:hypothetical protein